MRMGKIVTARYFGIARRGPVAAVAATVWGLKEARAGYYPAAAVVDQLGTAFVEALKGERPSAGRGCGPGAAG
jgi:hypothetical protein